MKNNKKAHIILISIIILGVIMSFLTISKTVGDLIGLGTSLKISAISITITLISIGLYLFSTARTNMDKKVFIIASLGFILLATFFNITAFGGFTFIKYAGWILGISYLFLLPAFIVGVTREI